MKNITSNLFGYITYSMFFLMPLLTWKLTSEEYEYPKTYFLYFSVLILFLLLMFERKVNFSVLHKSILLYLFVNIISSVFAGSTYNAFWGYYSRLNDGLFSLFIFLLFYIFLKNSKGLLKIRYIVLSILLSQIPVFVVSLFQIGDLIRIYSTFGQPNWFAAYLVFVLFLNLEQIKLAKGKYHKVFWIALTLINSSLLFFANSVSAYLAMFLGTIILMVSLPEYKKYLSFVFILLICLLFVSRIRTRVIDVFNFSANPDTYTLSDSGLIRKGLWLGTLKLTFSSPKVFLLGVGPENFAYEYPAFRDSVLNLSSEWNFIMNKPHNYFLEVFVENGVFGLLSYLWMLFVFFKKSNIFLKVSLISFVVTNSFGFPSVYLSLLFWTFFAISDQLKIPTQS